MVHTRADEQMDSGKEIRGHEKMKMKKSESGGNKKGIQSEE